MNRARYGVLIAVLLSGLAAGCKSTPKEDTRPLYYRLGGEPALVAVVDDFVARVAADPEVNFTRKGTGREWDGNPANLEHLRKMLVQYIGAATGGPNPYKGKDVVTAHRGMKITNAQFDAAAADLQASLNALKIPAREQADLMAVVEGTRKQIVEVK